MQQILCLLLFGTFVYMICANIILCLYAALFHDSRHMSYFTSKITKITYKNLTSEHLSINFKDIFSL